MSLISFNFVFGYAHNTINVNVTRNGKSHEVFAFDELTVGYSKRNIEIVGYSADGTLAIVNFFSIQAPERDRI